MANNSLGLYSQFNHLLPTAFHNLSVQSTGGGGGSQTLAQTLVYGNSTGGNDIIQTSGDALRSSTNADLRLELDGNGTTLVEQTSFAGTGFPAMRLQSIENTGNGTTLELYKNSATPANGDLTGVISFYGKDDASFKTQYGLIECQIDDITSTSQSSHLNFVAYDNGSPLVPLQVYPNTIVPTAISDTSLSTGTSGQILSSTGTGLAWINNAPNEQIFAMNNLNTISFASLGVINTANILPIGSNALVTANNGFTLDNVNNRIVYNGVSGKRFYIQTSASIQGTATNILGIELRINNSPISQCRIN
jgi:hypothetical protein